jgi:hypothetical protein
MRTKLIVPVSIVSLFTNIPGLFAGTWVKKTTFDEGRNYSRSEITNEKTPESSREGLFMRRWTDANDTGISMVAWAQTEKKSKISDGEIYGNTSGQYIHQSYNWSEKNPPRTAFSLDWTEAFYVRNSGNCDNRSLFNNKGAVETADVLHFCFMSGPDHIMNNYGVQLTAVAENRENKIAINPKGYYRFGIKTDSFEPYWDNKPDKGKSWDASVGDIISFSVGMDNGNYNNTNAKGYVSSAVAHAKLKDNAKSSYASIFHELSGFNMNMDQIISEKSVNYPSVRRELVNNPAFGQLRQVWVRVAQRSGLSPNSFFKVTSLLNRIQGTYDIQTPDESLLTDSIKRYLEQFAYTFQGEHEEQACYYMAWLLIEAAARDAITSEDKTNTRVSFENLIDRLISVLNENAKQAIGDANSSVIQEELKENLARVKGRLFYYFYELREDPLFPVFKKPIDKNIQAIIIKKFENEKILFNLLNNQIKSEPESEFYKKWLSFYFDRVAERVVFWLVIETNKDEFRNPQYWGGMHYRARSCKNGPWPVEIYLTRIQEE